MDYERLMETIAGEDQVTYTYENGEGITIHNTIDVISVTMFSNTIEILGQRGNQIEMATDIINTIEYVDDDIIITTETENIFLHLDSNAEKY